MRDGSVLLICTLAAATLATATATATRDVDEYVVHVRTTHASMATAEDGSKIAPFKTIEAARDHLRAVRSSSANGVERRFRVSIGSGVYPPLVLGAQDSGTPGREVVYEAERSVAGGRTVISGGLEIPKSAFQPCVNPPLPACERVTLHCAHILLWTIGTRASNKSDACGSSGQCMTRDRNCGW